LAVEANQVIDGANHIGALQDEIDYYAVDNRRLQRTRRERASLFSCVGELLKHQRWAAEQERSNY
jgi:hypothetical protein